jgi:histidyl-tRNA synthetase
MTNKNIIRSVKGTRDYYPYEMGVRTWLYQKMKEVSESFGYFEYEGPMLEKFELYAAKSGEEIVEKQSYVFEDRSGEKLTLRPELTPTLARMVATKQNQLTFPLRWWSFGPFWRYERPQKGRTREFFQWNIDLIGHPSFEADAEIIAIAAKFLQSIGLKSSEAKILINNRELMDSEIKKIGIPDDAKKSVFDLIDRKDKMSYEKWDQNALDIGLTKDQIIQIKQLITNDNLWKNSETLVNIFSSLKTYGISDYVQFAPHIIRGLLYYTGTVFEAWDTKGEHRAIFGGGRYNNLIGDVGGNPVGGVGFAVGDLVISLILKENGYLPKFGDTPAPVYMTNFSKALIEKSNLLSNKLRSQGIMVTNHLGFDKLGKQLKYASRIGAKFAIIIGDAEVESGIVILKILETGEQISVSQNQLTNKILQLLEANSPL